MGNWRFALDAHLSLCLKNKAKQHSRVIEPERERQKNKRPLDSHDNLLAPFREKEKEREREREREYRVSRTGNAQCSSDGIHAPWTGRERANETTHTFWQICTWQFSFVLWSVKLFFRSLIYVTEIYVTGPGDHNYNVIRFCYQFFNQLQKKEQIRLKFFFDNLTRSLGILDRGQ